MADWGFIVVLPGYSVWTATDNQIVFNSARNIYKTILDKSGYTITANNWTSTTINHGQPIPPAFLVFRKLSSSTNRFTRLGGTNDWNPFLLGGGPKPYVTSTQLVTYGYKSAYFTFLERRV